MASSAKTGTGWRRRLGVHCGCEIPDETGEIPEEIGNLLSLEILSIGSVGLTGQIPASIFNISSLQVVYLSNNSLSVMFRGAQEVYG
ncbi:hypothetical protein COLO4_17603 [Corchorus olitorius]|uniref:Uncharacterized protein n=1 Tax=Corchorus olitorius TaxID=93759 RepID=A0A1R3JC43_9ROSI|nr:hypothetical protein COLO4_17603 [Corchorus olitorius]